MNSKLLTTTLGFPLVFTSLLNFSNAANAAVFSAGSELQIQADLTLPGDGTALFRPEVPGVPNIPAPVGNQAIVNIGTGNNSGSFEVFNSPPVIPVQGEILSIDLGTFGGGNPVPFLPNNNAFNTIDAPFSSVANFIELPAQNPEPGETADPITATTFNIDSLQIRGVNFLGTLDAAGDPANGASLFESFQIIGTGNFLNEGDRTDAEFSFTAQGYFFEDGDGDGLITLGNDNDVLDFDGSFSGSIITLGEDEPNDIPEPGSALAILGLGSLIATTKLGKRKRQKA